MICLKISHGTDKIETQLVVLLKLLQEAVFTALAAEATGGQNSDGEMDPDDPVFATFGANTLKIRMRAHPDVSAAHYAGVDLTDL